MREFIHQHLADIVALVVLVSRAGDILTTLLASPTLKLETNAVARRLGRWYVLATLLVALVPYYSIPLGVVIATASLLVSASNAAKIMIARGLGEQRYYRLVQDVVSRTSVPIGVAYVLLPATFMALLGGTMLLFFPDPGLWGFYFATGVFAYAVIVAFWGLVRFLTLKRNSRKELPDDTANSTASDRAPDLELPRRAP